MVYYGRHERASSLSMMLKKRTYRSFILLPLLCCCLFFASCASRRAIQKADALPQTPALEDEGEKAETLEEKGKGIFHIVKRGENLYRIAKTYGVDMNELAQLNGISDPSKIDAGQAIFIPNAVKQLPVPIIGKKGAATLNGSTFARPVSGAISSHFGEKRHGYYHSGIDILAPYGTGIVAARDGIVVFSGYERGYGRMVIINHEDGCATVYAHNSSNLVEVGDRVSRGEVIAHVGKSGNATGPHVHFEIRVEDNAIDPAPYID